MGAAIGPGYGVNFHIYTQHHASDQFGRVTTSNHHEKTSNTLVLSTKATTMPNGDKLPNCCAIAFGVCPSSVRSGSGSAHTVSSHLDAPGGNTFESPRRRTIYVCKKRPDSSLCEALTLSNNLCDDAAIKRLRALSPHG